MHMDMNLFAEIIGISGATIYIFAYAQLQLKRDYAKTFTYSFMNFAGGSMVLFSLLFAWNTASLISNIMWVVVSMYGMFRCIRHATPEKVERIEEIADAIVPDPVANAAEAIADVVIDVTPGPPPKPVKTKAKK